LIAPPVGDYATGQHDDVTGVFRAVDDDMAEGIRVDPRHGLPLTNLDFSPIIATNDLAADPMDGSRRRRLG
jgi:hypothetical protein